jgi:5-hydroxyisourate hydrolase
MSQLTTHILDTSAGKPAAGIRITLYRLFPDNQAENISEGITDSDGRVRDLVKEGQTLDPGNYKICFETGEYFLKNKIRCFYPFVEIVFEITDNSHYHVPLLLNPFGYSTYRGS